MNKITLGGKMIGVAGIQECDTCKWAKVHKGTRPIVSGNGTCTQTANAIFDCTNNEPKELNTSGIGMKCSGYSPREQH